MAGVNSDAAMDDVMKFKISRTSDYYGINPPVPTAINVQRYVEDKFIHGKWEIEICTLEDLLKLFLYKDKEIVLSIDSIEMYDSWRE